MPRIIDKAVSVLGDLYDAAKAKAREAVDKAKSSAAEAIGRKKAAALAKERAAALKADPDLAAKEAAKTREALGMSFSGDPAEQAGVQACEPSKAQRRRDRKALIGKARAKCPNDPKVKAAADRLEREMDDVERARLARHVYISPDDPELPPDIRNLPAPEGFMAATEEDLAKLGLTPGDLSSPPSQFKAQVYKYDPAVWGPEYADKYAVAMRGSTLAEEDWVNNFQNGMDADSDYYKRATLLGQKIKQSGQAANVDAAGHSLGGGLAQALHAGSGGAIPATTFNSAGVAEKLASRYIPTGAFDDAKITAYRVKGEALTQAQEHGLGSHLMPSARGIKHDLDAHDPTLRGPKLTGDQRTDLHGINGVILSMEDEKTADEATLTQATAPPNPTGPH